jgi:hypothetical protein
MTDSAPTRRGGLQAGHPGQGKALGLTQMHDHEGLGQDREVARLARLSFGVSLLVIRTPTYSADIVW